MEEFDLSKMLKILAFAAPLIGVNPKELEMAMKILTFLAELDKPEKTN